VDRAVWEQLGHDRTHVKELAELIRDGIKFAEELAEAQADDDLVFAEGRVATETHVRRERSPKIRKQLLRKRRSVGRLKCDICGAEPRTRDEALHDAMFEAHHVLPLAAGKERTTRLKDMALLCANCHRLTHRAIAIAKRWLTLEQAKGKIL
jgi:5-methylcytosine-specific restriction protein A